MGPKTASTTTLKKDAITSKNPYYHMLKNYNQERKIPLTQSWKITRLYNNFIRQINEETDQNLSDSEVISSNFKNTKRKMKYAKIILMEL